MDEAAAGVKGVAENIRGVGTASAEAATGATALGAGMDKATQAAGGLGAAAPAVAKIGTETKTASKEMQQLQFEASQTLAAMEKMAAAGESPRRLGQATAYAQLKMEELKAAIDRARAAGEQMPVGITKNLATMQTAIDTSTTRLGRMRDVQGDVKTRADQMGQSWVAASQAGGSLSGMLNQMESSGSKVISSFGKIGLAAGGVAGAFMLGLEAGKKLDQGLKAMGVDFSEYGRNIIMAAQGTADFGEKIKDWNIVAAPNMVLLRELAKAARDLDAQLKLLIPSWGKSAEEEKKFQLGMEALEKTFSAVAGDQEKFTFAVRENQRALIDWVEKGIKSGKIKLEELGGTLRIAYEQAKLYQGAIDANRAADEANAKALAEAKKALDAYITSMGVAVEGLSEEERAWYANSLAIDQEIDAMNRLTEAADRTQKKLKEVADTPPPQGLLKFRSEITNTITTMNGIETAGQNVIGIFLEIARASEKATDAIHKMTDAMGDQGKAAEEAFKDYPKLLDYVATLTEGYKQGYVSLIAYIQGMKMASDQLRKLAADARNTGDQTASLNKMIAAIEALLLKIQQAPIPGGGNPLLPK